MKSETLVNKDSIISIKTHESSIILPDSLVFSSDLPGFNVKNSIEVKTEYKKGNIELAHQFISGTYLDLFIILSIALLTVYLVCCPKRKLENQLRGKSIQINSI